MARLTVTFLVLAGLLLMIFIFRREDPSGALIRTRMLMGTVVEIQVLDNNADQYNEVVTAAFAEMARVEKLMSPHVPESDINRISSSEKVAAVDAETAEVLETALAVSVLSHGAFDPGLGRLIRLWGFAEGIPTLPEHAAIEKALTSVGPGSLRISANQVSKRSPQLAVDLGGVAKGYAIDRAISVLAAAGVRHASVNAGGDMRLLGNRGDSLWRIGIQHPRQPGKILARLNLADRAIVTSGDYERYFEREKVRYHHILDPRTGYPAKGCQAVTVVAEEAAYADAMATAVFVLGADAGLALLLDTAGVEGLIVAADGRVEVTPGLKEMVTWP